MKKPVFNLFGEIVADESARWFDSDVVPAMVVGWLAKHDGEDVEININSPGGDVAAGLAIANAIKAHKGKTSANVLGIAASMASAVACACDEVKMGDGAFLMIHNPWTHSIGDAEDLRHDAEVLDKMRDSIVGFYQSKTSLGADDLKALMDAESWLTRDELAANGFAVGDYAADEEPVKAAACLTRRHFDRAPDAAKVFFSTKSAPLRSGEAPAPVQSASPSLAADDIPQGGSEQPPRTAAADGLGESASSSEPAPVDWEARFKGLQAAKDKEIAALKAEVADAVKRGVDLAANLEADYKAKLDAANAAVAERDEKLAAIDSRLSTLQSDLDAKSQALDAAKADAEQLAAKCAGTEKALAETRAALEVETNRYRAQVGAAMQPPAATDGRRGYALIRSKFPAESK